MSSGRALNVSQDNGISTGLENGTQVLWIMKKQQVTAVKKKAHVSRSLTNTGNFILKQKKAELHLGELLQKVQDFLRERTVANESQLTTL